MISPNLDEEGGDRCFIRQSSSCSFLGEELCSILNYDAEEKE